MVNQALVKSPLTRVNALLKEAGRQERLIRGRGYYYLSSGEAFSMFSSSIYVYRLDKTEEDFNFARQSVNDLFKANDITVTI